MKKMFIIGLIIVLLIIGASLFINNSSISRDSTNKSQESVELSKNGITLLVPGDWVSAKSLSNDSVIAVADSNSKDSSGYNSISVNVEKKSNVYSLESEFNSNYKSLARNSDYKILYEGNISFNGEDAMEADYTSTSSGFLKQHKAIWIKKNSDIYVILCTAPQNKFSSEESIFDFIINNIKFN